MMFRSAPVAASWFLNQFGSFPENESVIGDLTEQYQRGRGSIWYWRQVLAIVYGGLYQEFRRNKRQFIGGLIRIWCLAGGLHFAAGLLLIWRHHMLNQYPSYFGMTASGFPLLTLRIRMGPSWLGHHPDQWDISLISVALNVLLPLLLGRLIAGSSDIHPRTLLLAYTTSFMIANCIWASDSIRMLLENQHNATGFLASSLIAMPLVPVLLFIGAGLSRNNSEVEIGEQGA